MKRIPTTWFRLLLLSWMLLVARPTQAQGWQGDWITPVSNSPQVHYQPLVGPNGQVQVYSIECDPNGNVYTVGQFAGRVSIGPFVLTSDTLMSSFYGPLDGFVGKLNPFGQWQWAVPVAGNEMFHSLTVHHDPATDAIYLAGFTSSDTVRIGDKQVVNPLPRSPATGAGKPFCFLARLNSQGTCTWVQTVGDWRSPSGQPSYTRISTITFDERGSAILGGGFASEVVRFGPFSLTNTSTFIAGSRQGDGFIAKIDSSGQWQWAQAIASPQGEYVYSLLAAPGGSIYVAGATNADSLRLGPWRVSSPAILFQGSVNWQTFIGRLDSTGQWQWAKPITAQGYAGIRLWQVSSTGDVVVSGSYQVSGTVSLPPYTLTFSPQATPTYDREAFVALLSANGQWQWATPLHGSGNKQVNVARLTPSNELLIAGSFTDSLTLNRTRCYVSDTLNYGAGAGYVASLSASTGAIRWGMPLNAPVKFHQVRTQPNGQTQLLATGFESSLLAAGIPLAVPSGPASLGGSIISLVINARQAFIKGFSQPTGTAGTTLYLTGRFFSGATQLRLNGQPVPFVVVTDSLAQMAIPAGATSGYVQLTTPHGSAQSPLVLRVTAPLLVADQSVAAGAALVPNPAHNRTYLLMTAAPGVPTAGQLLDATGRTVRRFAVQTITTPLELGGLPAGIYTVRVGRAAHRLVVE